MVTKFNVGDVVNVTKCKDYTHICPLGLVIGTPCDEHDAYRVRCTYEDGENKTLIFYEDELKECETIEGKDNG